MFFYLQGRDAGDQHIIDVVLKMLQGEKSLMSEYRLQERLRYFLEQFPYCRKARRFSFRLWIGIICLSTLAYK